MVWGDVMGPPVRGCVIRAVRAAATLRREKERQFIGCSDEANEDRDSRFQAGPRDLRERTRRWSRAVPVNGSPPMPRRISPRGLLFREISGGRS